MGFAVRGAAGWLATAAGTWYTTSTPTILRLRSGQALGSTSLATDASGAEVTDSRTLYYPYGGVRWPTDGSTLPTDFTFTGQRNDAALGRFISADTIVPEPGNPQSLNRYSYVSGNPLRYIDPSGHARVANAGLRPLDDDGTGGSNNPHGLGMSYNEGNGLSSIAPPIPVDHVAELSQWFGATAFAENNGAN
ncbi:MAG: RHS repeat-associated core domain-containing protein [Chloroflexota bacterium]|nr:RHS repeat-associated core domain-containing protein [Chloroflexota bacterium]